MQQKNRYLGRKLGSKRRLRRRNGSRKKEDWDYEPEESWMFRVLILSLSFLDLGRALNFSLLRTISSENNRQQARLLSRWLVRDNKNTPNTVICLMSECGVCKDSKRLASGRQLPLLCGTFRRRISYRGEKSGVVWYSFPRPDCRLSVSLTSTRLTVRLSLLALAV